MIAPHSSCRYAVLKSDRTQHWAEYVIAAVHAITTNGDGRTWLLVSMMNTTTPVTYEVPQPIPADRVQAITRTSADARLVCEQLTEENNR